MLSDEEKKAIDHEVEKVPFKRSASLEAMKRVQDFRGYISDDTLKEIAEYLEVSHHELESLATFYNLIFRKPVGRHVIKVCDSISCWVCGYEDIKEKVSSSLGIDYGQTTKDNRFTLIPIPCLGTCDHAPAMMVNENLHRDLKTEDVDKVLEQYE